MDAVTHGNLNEWKFSWNQEIWSKIAVLVMQHQLPCWEILDARPVRWPLQSMTSAQCLGSLASHQFYWKAFALPRLSSKYWSKKRNLTLLGYSVREVWVMVTVLSSALMTPRLKNKTKKLQNKNWAWQQSYRKQDVKSLFTRRKKAFLKSTVRFVGFKCK